MNPLARVAMQKALAGDTYARDKAVAERRRSEGHTTDTCVLCQRTLPGPQLLILGVKPNVPTVPRQMLVVCKICFEEVRRDFD